MHYVLYCIDKPNSLELRKANRDAHIAYLKSTPVTHAGPFLNEAGETEDRDLVGLWATSLQHQVDHLAGRMYFDNLSKVKRDIFLRKARKR